MYAKLTDELIDHRKIFHAGELIGRDGAAIALGMYAVGLLWSNKHLSDGVLPSAVVRSFRHVTRPVQVAAALTKAGLWERNGHGSWRIHDYAAFGNPNSASVKEKRKRDRDRKRAEREKEEAAHSRK
jgi:hypothetical protein